jgi:uncharacterized membrane protein
MAPAEAQEAVRAPRGEPGDNTSPASRNIQTIAGLDQAALHEQSTSDRISAAISRFVGSLAFVAAHIIWFAGWALWNVGLIPGLEPFDPYPFGLLTMLVSMEAVLVGTFVLITQNWMNRIAERRAHLDLQVNILAEQEMTLVLRMLRAISKKVGAEAEPQEKVEQYERLNVHELASALDEHLPKDN